MVARRRSSEPTLVESFDDFRSDYAAMRENRFRRRRLGTHLIGTNADYHYRFQHFYMRSIEEARDMDRNDAVVGSLIDRASVNTLQGGFKVRPKTGDRVLDADLVARWDEFADEPDNCDIQGENSFPLQEELALRSMLVDGDIFALPSEDGPIQWLEGHRCRTPLSTVRNVVHGIMLDPNRKRTQYWFTKDDINPLDQVKLVSQVDKVDARDEDGNKQVFHVYNPKRVTQTRGVTALAPIFDVLGMFEDIQFANVVKQQVVACISVFKERAQLGTGGGIPSTDGQLGAMERTRTRSSGLSEKTLNMRPGMIVEGEPGEKLTGFSPNIPNAEFFPHVRLILQLIGINLGLPLVLVLMDASETNFSGWRGAMDQARAGFRRNQRAMIARFHSPVWRWKVRQWMATDAAIRMAAEKSSINIFKHRWKARRWPYVQPLDDARADLLKLSNTLTSRTRYHEEDGDEWTDVCTEAIADHSFAIRAAKKEATRINAKFPDDQPVHWRELINLPMPQGFTVKLQGDDSESGDDQQQQPGDEKKQPQETK